MQLASMRANGAIQVASNRDIRPHHTGRFDCPAPFQFPASIVTGDPHELAFAMAWLRQHNMPAAIVGGKLIW